MTDSDGDDVNVYEPLASAIRDALTASGLTRPQAVKITGLSRQTFNRMINKRRPYRGKMPDPENQEKLAKLPGLGITEVQQAIARSMAWKIRDDRPTASALRSSAHNLVDQIPESELGRAVQILAAMI